MGGRSRSNSVEEITLGVPRWTNGLLFSSICVRVIFKQAVESFTVQLQVNLFYSFYFAHELNLYFPLITCL